MSLAGPTAADAAPARRSVVSADVLPDVVEVALERRHLDDPQRSGWTVTAPPPDAQRARPVLSRLAAVGRQTGNRGPDDAMRHVVAACHEPGVSQVMIVHGTPDGNGVYYGARRAAGVGAAGLDHILARQALTLAAHSPASRLDPAHGIASAALAPVERYLASAPVLAALTGIVPGPADDTALVDRLSAALTGVPHLVLVTAEPVPTTDVDVLIDECRAALGVLHSLVRRADQHTMGSTASTSDTRSVTTRTIGPITLDAPMAAALVAFAEGLGAEVVARMLPDTTTGHTTGATAGTSTGYATSTELLDARAEAAEALLRRWIDRLIHGRAVGLWSAAVYVAADDEATVATVAGALRGVSVSEPGLEPLREARLPAHVLRAALAFADPVLLQGPTGVGSHPLGTWFDRVTTLLPSTELGDLIAVPRHEAPGVVSRIPARFGLTPGRPDGPGVALGVVVDAADRRLGPVTVAAGSLNRHALIAGMPGFGKTTTAQSLLVEAWTELDVPFLVIEPVKAEYRALARHPRLRDRLAVYAVGDPAVTPLRLNPFAPVTDAPLFRHVDLLKAVFNASFPMFAGMSYILEEAMVRVYEERGWRLEDSAHPLLGPRPAPADLAALTPTLRDLHDMVERVLTERRYAPEVHQNMGAALRSRLRSLLSGAKGMAFDGARSVPAADLFGRPAVVELRNVTDDEEKAFVMALLLSQLFEVAEARQSDVHPAAQHPLQHITLIEEAHRLLRAPRTAVAAESADAQAKAVRLFTDLLAEMRAYGEGFVVADQIPSGLAPEVIKNSTVKIVHRLSAPDDRAVVSASMNLTDEQSRQLVRLGPGRAVVHDDSTDEALLVDVQATPMPGPGPARSGSGVRPDADHLRRNGACARCPRPCAFRAAEEATRSSDPARPFARRIAEALCSPDLDTAAVVEVWSAWSAAWRARRPDDHDMRAGPAYCQLSQLLHAELVALAEARCAAAGLAAVSPNESLRADRAARRAAEFCASTLGPEVPSSDALHTVHADIHRLLSGSPPVPRPGCAECTAPCRPLTSLATLPPATRATLLARATIPVPPETAARRLQAVLDDAPRSHVSAKEIGHCITTLAAAPLPAQDDAPRWRAER